MDKHRNLGDVMREFVELQRKMEAVKLGRILVEVTPPLPAMMACLFYGRPVTDRDLWLEA